MSSRNRYLSAGERVQAGKLPRFMHHAIAMIEGGSEVWLAKSVLEDDLQLSGFRVDYVEVADAETLEPIEVLGARPTRLFVAARIGGTRLIDNMPIAPARA